MMQLSLILLQFGLTTLMPVLCSMLAQELSKQILQGMYLHCKWFECWGYILTPYSMIIWVICSPEKDFYW